MITVFSLLNSEVKPKPLVVEVSLTNNIPSFHIIGLAAPEISESRDRIRAAIEKSGFEFPNRRIVINLSPANIHKRGTGLDLAIAIALLLEQDKPKQNLKVFAWGELGLEGNIKPVGQINRAIDAALQSHCDLFFLHPTDAKKIRFEFFKDFKMNLNLIFQD